MTIPNTESTLATALGVSGTLSGRRGLYPITPLTMIWRRNFDVDDTLKSALGVQAGMALADQTINVIEGQWVTLAAGKAVIPVGDFATKLAWPAFAGGDRLDPKGGITVIHGAFVADTTFFDRAGVYTVGQPLKVGTGTVNINGVNTAVQGCLKVANPAVLADVVQQVAVVEQIPYGVGPDTPDGILRIMRV